MKHIKFLFAAAVMILLATAFAGCKEQTATAGQEPTEYENAAALMEEILYDVNVGVGYEGNYLFYRGAKPIARDFQNTFGDMSQWETYQGKPDPETGLDPKLGQQLGSFLDFSASDAMYLTVTPYQDYTSVTLSKGYLGDEDQAEYSFLADKDLHAKILAVKNRYNDEIAAEMRAEDGSYLKIYGAVCTKDAPSLYLIDQDLGDGKDLLQLTKLESLRLENVTLDQSAVLGQLTSLKQLSLVNTTLDSYDFLEKLTNLQSLTMKNGGTPELPSLSNLNRLDLTDTKVKNLDFLANAKELDTVVLKGSDISTIAPLKNSVKITWLDLTGTKVSDISPVTAMTGLKGLILTNTEVTDVSCLKPLRQVEFLTTPFPYNEQIKELQRAWEDHAVQFKYSE